MDNIYGMLGTLVGLLISIAILAIGIKFGFWLVEREFFPEKKD